MQDFLVYLFWPLPSAASYGSPKVIALLVVCAALVLLSFVLRLWRRRLTNSITKRLSKSWPAATFWFGIVGLFLVVCRVEDISYLSMRVWWAVWVVGALVYLFLQFKVFTARHYEKIPTERIEDPREKYLPKPKK